MTTFTSLSAFLPAKRASSIFNEGRSLRRKSVLAHLTSIAALFTADLIAFSLALLAALITSQVVSSDAWLGPAVINSSQLYSTLLVESSLFVAVIVYLTGKGFYTRRIPFWSEIQGITTASFAALLGSGFVQYFLQKHDSRLLLIVTWFLFPTFIMTCRAIARWTLIAAGLWHVRVVVVGDADLAQKASTALLSEPRLGYKIGAVLAPPSLGSKPGPGLWREILRRNGCELLVLAHDEASEIAESLVRGRVPFAIVPPMTGLPVHGFERTSLLNHETVLFTFSNNLAEPVARGVKVVFDVCAAFVLLIALLPVLVFITILVSLDGGPVLYAHFRVGVSGRMFPCFKFRSMVVNSDVVLQTLMQSDPAAATEWEETQKLRYDPRVTWIGRLLRKTSLDELPQLLNVLRLEMSLVGPRPIVPAEVQRYGDDIAYYYEARPGLTGLWQVSGRSDTGYAQRVRLDTWYVKNWSIWQDIAILFKTIPAVLKRRGAV